MISKCFEPEIIDFRPNILFHYDKYDPIGQKKIVLTNEDMDHLRQHL